MNILLNAALGGEDGVVGQINESLEARINQALTGVEAVMKRAITNAPSQLVDGIEFVAYKKIEPSMTDALDSLLTYIRENPEMNFGDAEARLEGLQGRLDECDKNNATALKEVTQEAFSVLKDLNVHIFGMSLNPVNLEGEVRSFSKLKLKQAHISSRVSIPELVRDESPTTDLQRTEFAEQRDLLVKNLRRIALVELVYQYVIGKSTGHFKEIFALEEEADFEEAFFNQIQADIGETWWPYRTFVSISSFLIYKIASFILVPFIKGVGEFGYDTLSDGINSLNKKENANALHDHIFESFRVYLDQLHGRYRAIANPDKKDEGAEEVNIHKQVLEAFRNSPKIHLGRTSQEFDHLLIEHLVKKMPMIYPLRCLVSFSLKRANAVNWLFEKIEGSKLDKDGFSYAMDEMLSNVLEDLADALSAPPLEEDSSGGERVSKVKRQQISDFFEVLLDAIPLAQLGSGKALQEHLDKEKEAKGSSIVRDQILLPAARGGVDSLSLALKKLLTPVFVQNILNQSIRALNRGYTSREEITAEMKIEAKERLEEVQGRVLELSVRKGMGEISRLNPDQERDSANRAITALKDRTQQFIDDIGEAIRLGAQNTLNNLWNLYILDIKKQESRVQKDGKIGPSLKQELSVNYYNRVARELAPYNKGGDHRPLLFTEEMTAALLPLLQEVKDSMPHVLSYDIIGKNMAGFGKDSIKHMVLDMLDKKANALFALTFHPTMLPYGIGNYMIFRPFLEREGVTPIPIKS